MLLLGQALSNCTRNNIDLLFILDGSASVQAANFDLMREFAVSIVEFMDISTSTSRFDKFPFSFSFQIVLKNERCGALLAGSP
jgi:hypothetical protein